MGDELGERFARNVKQLREARGLTQQQIAKAADVPRATWANLESGEANPTLSVLHRAACAFYEGASIPVRKRGQVTVKKLLPDPIRGMEMDRLELAPRGGMTGVPHTPGTREYLTCETGEIILVAAGERYHLRPGDLVAFRGDQRHSYANPTRHVSVGYSVVVLAPD